MPEGDTVYRMTQTLDRALRGKQLISTDFRVPQLATAQIAGRTLSEVASRGKHILMRTSDGLTVHSHLKMEGSWELYRPGQRWKGGFSHEVRAVVETKEWVAVGYRLGIIEVISTADELNVLGHLGPDLLGPDWDSDEALRRLRAKPDRAIGEALLDQRNLAGIGNLYKNESLFVSGVHPLTPVGEVRSLGQLVETARRMLELNKRHWSQTTTGNTMKGNRHWVFERSGEACRRCGTPIASAEQGEAGAQRLTYWCPHCQPERAS